LARGSPIRQNPTRRKKKAAQTTVRILLVDDYEPWRRFLCRTLSALPNVQIIGEVSDGLEAVKKFQELHPNLILLDIGLPQLNGFDVASRIRQSVLKPKILFVSGLRDPDIAEGAFSAGANGYLLKSDAARDLLPAIEAVLKGESFVSAQVALSPPHAAWEQTTPASSASSSANLRNSVSAIEN
jgi:DNA-binding NarL/FixJ family response regulator